MPEHGAEILQAGEEPIIADIVFVHGLGGDRNSTWQKDNVVWPRDLLSKEDSLRQVRIITVSTSTSLSLNCFWNLV